MWSDPKTLGTIVLYKHIRSDSPIQTHWKLSSYIKTSGAIVLYNNIWSDCPIWEQPERLSVGFRYLDVRYVRACVRSYAYMHVRIYIYVCTCAHYIRTYMPTYLHTYVPTYLRTCAPTYIHTHVRTTFPNRSSTDRIFKYAPFWVRLFKSISNSLSVY